MIPRNLRPLLIGAACAAAAFAVPAAASAQPFPDQTITGVVQGWQSGELLTLKDDRGYIDTVSIGDETQVPGGRNALAPGARISIKGYNGGQWFDASHIDILASAPAAAPQRALPSYAYGAANPYPYAANVPAGAYQTPAYDPNAYDSYAYDYDYAPYAYAYGYPYYGYGYPYYGYGYGYGYGARLNIGIGFGGYHGGYHGGGYGSYGGYHGGGYHGGGSRGSLHR